MSLSKIEKVLSRELNELKQRGSLKGEETVVTGVKQAQGGKGPRYFIRGYGDKEFLRMNSNSYLGMGLRKEVIEKEEEAARKFGAGPGAVRFISGTYEPHIELEKRLARFHSREAGMIFSSAYATVMGILSPLISKDTMVISDALNHNCIINALRLSRPKDKKIYSHNNMEELDSDIKKCFGNCERVIIVTDGIFSMRGDNAPLPEIADLVEKYSSEFEEGILTIVDDSHGVGAIGETGRGTMEFTHENRVDILVSTMGKGLGINGGYLVSDAKIIDYLRETAPFYIYSNPITVSEASSALRALEILDSEMGRKMLKYLCELTAYFRKGLIDLGYEVIKGEHPVVPLMVRDTRKTIRLVKYLKDNGILSTGIYYPVVPKGDEEIRFQICADQTKSDINYLLKVLEEYRGKT
ncbi:MAG: aminotransferase class I/II-fold pyridoxal phosphate-dependent enzyme [Candidatus Aerophobetes bacterium]|nr:aminotransferase class I/II-fold pyridoxal phosphate-dependent enzyme [Candidatus Aerophobetes bacterium]